MNVSRALTRLARPVLKQEVQQIRQFGNIEKMASVERLKKIQKEFAVNDGRPLYLKKGLRDEVLYKFTLASVIGGTIYSLYFLVNLARGKK